MVKKITIFILVLLFIISFSTVAQAGVKIWPGKVYITINQWGEETAEIKHQIQVTNPFDYGIDAMAHAEQPHPASLEGGYSVIPDASWVKIVPDTIYVPPKSSETFEVVITIPEDKQDLYYNEKWDARAVISSNYRTSGGAYNFKVDLAVKLLITTPKGEVERSQYLPIFIFLIIGCAAVYIISHFITARSRKSESVYYFKKEKKK